MLLYRQAGRQVGLEGPAAAAGYAVGVWGWLRRKPRLPPHATWASRLSPASWLLTGRLGVLSTSPPVSNTAAAPMPAGRGREGPQVC